MYIFKNICISTSYAGSWLWAIPNSNLGFSMSPHKFVIAVRHWLGIKMFASPPASVLRSCGQQIDTFGDHLLGCCVLVQSAHVDAMYWHKLFSRPYWLRTEML